MTSYLSFSTKIAPGKYNQVGLAMYELPNMIFAWLLFLLRPRSKKVGRVEAGCPQPASGRSVAGSRRCEGIQIGPPGGRGTPASRS
jgi:hypothetical protein